MIEQHSVVEVIDPYSPYEGALGIVAYLDGNEAYLMMVSPVFFVEKPFHLTDLEWVR